MVQKDFLQNQKIKSMGGVGMNAYDFEYDGLNLSDRGYLICTFNDNGDINTVTNGAKITFNTVPVSHGEKHEFIGSSYNECLSAVFQICKDPCIYDEQREITYQELRYLSKWLNRREFHKFKLLSDDYMDLYFEASFNLSKIELDGKVYGMELEMVTNRPFAVQEPIVLHVQNDTENGMIRVTNTSDEEGYVYPTTRIELLDEGDLEIYNVLDNRTTFISDCKKGEIITMDYPVIYTSDESHKIQDSFNWNFLRLANTFRTGRNDMIVSLPCVITLTYSPLVKIGI